MNPDSPLIKRPRLRLRVTAAAEAALRRGHPWLFSDRIREQNRPGQLGEIAAIYDRADRFLAVGLFDPDSTIRVRVLASGKPRVIDRDWWSERLGQALARRDTLFDTATTGHRWIHGEADGWPGLVLDRYDTTLVLKLYSAAWLPHLELIQTVFSLRLQPQRIVLRLSRNIQQAARPFAKSDGTVLYGPPPAGPVVFLESGLRFEADVLRGQKTGFFLDQRENRRRVESLAAGRTVLNAFSFTGGFSLYAARGGARRVTDLDQSAHALAGGGRNFALNHAIPAVAACHRETAQADAFDWLKDATPERFDMVVLDPPSLAKREAERASALGAYERLAALGIARLSAGGILFACSCSAHVTAAEFYQAVRRAVTLAGRTAEELITTSHPPDHPGGFSEGQYLKAICLRLKR
jgi:23S rRNA (cytosine1962-C5)-methyltransferase